MQGVSIVACDTVLYTSFNEMIPPYEHIVTGRIMVVALSMEEFLTAELDHSLE